jgi:hypothetical protein
MFLHAPENKIQEFQNVLFYHFNKAMETSILALNKKATDDVFTFMFKTEYLLKEEVTANEIMYKFSYITEEQDAYLLLSMFDNSNPHQLDVPSY